MRKFIPILMAMCLALSIFAVPASAGEVNASGTSGSSEVTLDVEEPVFNITVPTALPVYMDATGEVTVSHDLVIQNASHGMIQVTGIEITAASDWAIVDFATDMSRVAMNSNKIGFSLNGDTTGADGAFAFTTANWPAVNAADVDGNAGELAIVYDAVISGSTEAINAATVATVVFTIDWATAG